MKPTRWADTNFLVHTKVSGVQWRRAESLLIYIENLTPFFVFFRSLKAMLTTSFLVIRRYFRRSLYIINHGLFIAISVFFRFSCSPPPVRTCDDRAGCQGSLTIARLCRETSLSCCGSGDFRTSSCFGRKKRP